MNLEDLSDEERLIIGLRYRLKHIREALAEVEAGRTPEGFEFSDDDSADDMRAELRRLEADVQGMLHRNGANEGRLLS